MEENNQTKKITSQAEDLHMEGNAAIPEKPKSKFKLSIIIGTVLFLILLVTTYTTYAFMKAQKQTACATDAKVCPDGATVGRIGAHCEFGKCPVPSISPTPAPVENIDNLFSVTLPDGWTKTIDYDPYAGKDHNVYFLSPDFKQGGQDQSTGTQISVHVKVGTPNEDLKTEANKLATFDPKGCTSTVKEITIGGVRGYEGICDRVAGRFNPDYSRYYFFKNGQYVWSIMTFAYKANSVYFNQIDQILSTFKFTK